MCYALVARWLYLANRKKKNKLWLIQGTRFLSILFNLVYIRGVIQHKWQMVNWFVQWYKISHLVKDQHFIQLGFASLNRTSIFHLMQNLVRLHNLPFAICILFNRLCLVIIFIFSMKSHILNAWWIQLTCLIINNRSIIWNSEVPIQIWF